MLAEGPRYCFTGITNQFEIEIRVYGIVSNNPRGPGNNKNVSIRDTTSTYSGLQLTAHVLLLT